jgi:coenzyme F420-reducing hydrogenase alpha subunit
MKIKIDHIAKIEGHAGFVGHIIKGNVKKAQIEVQEGARLIESLLIGRNYEDVPVVTSRICGLCPVVHMITSIKALEDALGIKPTEETVLLREIMLAGQIIESHVLHIFFLSATDFFKHGDGLDLAKEKPELVKKILRVRDFGNNTIKAIGGRTIHPLTPKVGGWHKNPTKKDLEKIKKETKNALLYSKALVDFILSLKMPNFERKTEYIAYCPKEKYIGYYGLVKSSEGWNSSEKEFRKGVKEYQKEGMVVKLASHKGKSYATDALARIQLNSNNLNPKAKKMLKDSALKIPNYNPFYNILAQSIEVAHLIEEIQKMIEKLEKMDLKNLNTEFRIKQGEGVGILEAPRGLLYHYYKVNSRGIVIKSDIVTPTAQLLVNLNDDLKEYLPKVAKYKKKRREHEILKLVHSYDPCISCSVH